MKSLQHFAACAALLLHAGACPAGEPGFVAATLDFEGIRVISPTVFDSVKLPIKLRDLVARWGLAWRPPNSGLGLMYWRCTDGRVAISGSVSDPEQLLYRNVDGELYGELGDNWLMFLSKEEASKRSPFSGILQIR